MDPAGIGIGTTAGTTRNTPTHPHTHTHTHTPYTVGNGVYIDRIRERLRAAVQRHSSEVDTDVTFFSFSHLSLSAHCKATIYLPDGQQLHVASLARQDNDNAIANITITLNTAHSPFATSIPSPHYGGADFSSPAAPPVGARPRHAGAVHAARGAVVVFAWLSAARCRDGRDESGERSGGVGVIFFGANLDGCRLACGLI